MQFSRIFTFAKWTGLALVLLAVGLGWALSNRWLPRVQARLGLAPPAAEADEHGEHAHDEHGAGDANSIALSPQARRNIGLRTGEVTPRDYNRSITIPAMVVPRVGRTHVKVAAPLAGIVTGVYIANGQVVHSGDLLFKLRLTREELVQAQIDFLRTINQLDVENREIKRLTSIASGAVAGKIILQHKYNRDKLMADLQAQREALRLHGLSEAQVDRIERERKLLREMEVRAPLLHADESLHNEAEEPHSHPQSTMPNLASTSLTAAGSAEATPVPGETLEPQRFIVSSLDVRKGQGVVLNDLLCVLSDLSTLYVEGRAFEQDADELVRASRQKNNIVALLENGESDVVEAYVEGREFRQTADESARSAPQKNDAPALLESGESLSAAVEGLSIAYVANEVDPISRAMHFYVTLPNQVVRAEQRGERQYITWRFKPGQRMQLQVPVEQWEDVIVLPVEALAAAGPESYVFVANGKQFQRRPVHVQYRDQRNAVIANDGSLFPGEVVALNGAHQLQMAIKNKSGGGADPHAGHNH